MKGKNPAHGSGKTRFNREKASGESWTDRRAKAIQAGTFVMPKFNK